MDTMQKEVVVERENGSNTALIVIILLLIVGFGVWWFTTHRHTSSPTYTPPSVNIDVQLPGGSSNTSGTGGSGAPTGGTPSYNQ